MKKIVIILVVIIIVGFGLYFLFNNLTKKEEPTQTQSEPTTTTQEQESAESEEEAEEEEVKTETVIGKSVEGRNIMAYHYGAGEEEIIFIGGIHGGYAWNTVLLAYEIMDYFVANPEEIPDGIKVTIIPVLNPDGLKKVVGVEGRFTQNDVSSLQSVKVSGRFNANNVDLNRNFDCEWKSVGVWQDTNVSGGNNPFSEPESIAIRDYVKDRELAAVISWDSAAPGVFSSNCNNSILPETRVIAAIFAEASGYPAYDDFEFYELSGDMIDWFAKNKVPAISVLLFDHEHTEWSKNWAGIEALFDYYAE